MNTNTNNLLDADKDARQKLDEAQQYYDRALIELEEEKKAMSERYQERAKIHLSNLEAELACEVEELRGEVEKRTESLCRRMQAHYQENREAWEDTLVSRCIGRDRE